MLLFPLLLLGVLWMVLAVRDANRRVREGLDLLAAPPRNAPVLSLVRNLDETA